MGRKRIEIKRIEETNKRHVCFSKRRAGLFKKASELATLCGAEIAIIVFSPAGNPYDFGQPSANAVIDRYVSGGSDVEAPPQLPGLISGHGNKNNKTGGQYWWDGVDVEGMNSMEELEDFLQGLKGLTERVHKSVEELARDGASSGSNPSLSMVELPMFEASIGSNLSPSMVELPMSEASIGSNPSLSMVELPMSEASMGSNPSLSMMELPMSEPEPVIYEFCDQPSYGRAEVVMDSPCLSIMEMAMYEPEQLDLMPISEPVPLHEFYDASEASDFRNPISVEPEPPDSSPIQSMVADLLMNESDHLDDFWDLSYDSGAAFVGNNSCLSMVEELLSEPEPEPFDVFSYLDLGNCSGWISS